MKSLPYLLKNSIILEDDAVIIINKPPGIAVHGGTDNLHGVIEILRQLRPESPFLELAHRIDKETSGLLLLAKNRKTLLDLHESFKSGEINKHYQALVLGKWHGGERKVENYRARSRGGMQNMQVSDESDGKLAESVFTPMQQFPEHSLLSVRLLTGRMHQIRTQLADLSLPIAGDTKYGDFTRERESLDTANAFLNHGNYLAYGLAATTLWVLGIPHGFAVMHGKTRRGALVFDVADLIKDTLVLPWAFICASENATEQEFRQQILQAFTDHKSLDFMFDKVKDIALAYTNQQHGDSHD